VSPTSTCSWASLVRSLKSFLVFLGWLTLLHLLSGSLGCTTLQFIFPGMFCLKLFPEAPLYQKAISVFYILFGLAGNNRHLLQHASPRVGGYLSRWTHARGVPQEEDSAHTRRSASSLRSIPDQLLVSSILFYSCFCDKTTNRLSQQDPEIFHLSDCVGVGELSLVSRE